MDKIIDRFISYVLINTQSNPNSDDFPSSENQLKLASKLAQELAQIGLTEIEIDENGYLMASLESNIKSETPTIGFIAHLDTSPDFAAEGIQPQIIKAYNGTDIKLGNSNDRVLTLNAFPELERYIGQTLITTDGNTLLGADDKSGITAIVSAMEYLIQHPEIKHGRIRIMFTPDEEIGHGANRFNVEKFNAAWAYTIDGGEIGELEFENFNAAFAIVDIVGKSVHPGYAFNKMVNAALLANEFISLFPQDQIPAKTQNYEGFYHLTSIDATVSRAELNFIIRDFNAEDFEKRKNLFFEIADQLNLKYGEKYVSVEIENQYFNMRGKILPFYEIVELAEEAMIKAGIKPLIKPIRGGTDGARLSFMGLPCPNIFAGGHNFHGPYEFVPVESILKAMEVIVNICQLAPDFKNKP